MNKVRCTGCRGAKQVIKLGGMMGNCNLCKGEGEINECDVPLPVKPMSEVIAASVVSQVANVAPVTIEHKAEIATLPVEPDVKVDGKRAIYKRKTVTK